MIISEFDQLQSFLKRLCSKNPSRQILNGNIETPEFNAVFQFSFSVAVKMIIQPCTVYRYIPNSFFKLQIRIATALLFHRQSWSWRELTAARSSLGETRQLQQIALDQEIYCAEEIDS